MVRTNEQRIDALDLIAQKIGTKDKNRPDLIARKIDTNKLKNTRTKGSVRKWK